MPIKNPKKRSKYQREYRKANKERINEQKRGRHSANFIEINKRRRERYRELKGEI
jgi:hypothetical protein